MGLWIFMLIIVLFIPAIMILFGALFKKSVPGEINSVFGYRTNMSMKNKDTWEFAHRHLGHLWFRLGLILILPSTLALLFVLGQSKDYIGYTGATIEFFQLAILLLSLIPTERALRRTFYPDGSRKE